VSKLGESPDPERDEKRLADSRATLEQKRSEFTKLLAKLNTKKLELADLEKKYNDAR
jgi:hypothetical protein